MARVQSTAWRGTGASSLSMPHGLTPLFRWPGGKRWLVRRLLDMVPSAYGRYFEPFVGAGALFFALAPQRSVIADRNEQLIACYQAISRDPDRVAMLVTALPQDESAYYRIRSHVPSDQYEAAARLIYLATLAFNGIYRVNRLGEFNVPWSGRIHGDIGNAERLRKYAEILRRAEFRSGDFEQSLKGAVSGDLVYLDPPYTVAHGNNGFIKYNQHLFSWEDQERLALVAAELAEAGCAVLVSNAYHASIRALYPGFAAHPFQRSSRMAADGRFRGTILEYVLTNVR